ncbi:MAG TPA: hypothetical protein DCX06_02685 [Opitutae bacterium]|nr:hypothetical protein [Opitutae bacterium]
MGLVISQLRRRIIVFSGTDGAGKSTQIQLLDDLLVAEGVKVTQFWARGGYTPGFSLFKALIRKVRPGSVPKPGPSKARSQQFKSSRVRRTWLLISILDLILCYAGWLRLKQMLGYTVICDRYIEDTLLDFNHNFPKEDVALWWSWRLLEALAPRPRLRFLLIVPPEESARRSILKNEPFPDSPETLEWRYARYQELAKTGPWVSIDCLDSIEAVNQQILGAMESCD